MFAIGLIGLLLTMVFVSFKPDGAGPVLQEATVELEALAARGHAMSVLHQKPFWLSFEADRVVLRGATLESVGLNTLEEEQWLEEQMEGEILMTPSNIEEYGEYRPPNDLKLFVRRWGAKVTAWYYPEDSKAPVITWPFESTGLCEPISIRLERDESWTEIDMDPLTGRINEERSEIYD